MEIDFTLKKFYINIIIKQNVMYKAFIKHEEAQDSFVQSL